MDTPELIEEPESTRGRRGLSPGLLLGAVVLLGVAVAFHFALLRGEEIKKRGEGGRDAYVVSQLIRESLKYTFNDGYFPLWDKKPGVLFYDRTRVNPSYNLRFPLNRSLETYDTGVIVGAFENEYGYILKKFPEPGRYFYLPYAVTNEEEALALLAVYREKMMNGDTFDLTLEAPPGRGTYGTDNFYRAYRGIHRRISNEKQDIPSLEQLRKDVYMLIERPGRYAQSGGWVVNLEFKTKWMDYPGEFPMSERFINALEALEAEFRTVALEAEGT